MNIFQNAPASEQSFSHFLFHNRRNKTFLYLAAAAIIIQFSIFKYLYPFANYIHDDSFYYLDSATRNLTISGYPIGYSKFLRLVSVFAKPDLVLVAIQYLMIQCSTLFLLFTIFYFYRAAKATQAALLCFMVFNPLFLHLANMVSSDGLFLALSMTWFALLLWIIYKPSNKILFWHAVVLFIAFITRHNALIYPFIAVVAFWLSKIPLRKKLAGLGFALLLCGWFVGLTMVQYKKLTGYYQYSPFSGWQLANNALYAYRKVDSAARLPVPEQFRTLDKMNRNLFDRYPNLPVGVAGTYFMWAPSLTLMQYKDMVFNAKDSTAGEFKRWASMGPLYGSYGAFLIKQYPTYFLRHFVWHNALKYFFPPIEFLEFYNGGQPTVLVTATKWFGYKSDQVKTRMKDPRVMTLQFYPFFVSILNLFMLLGLLTYLLLKGWQFNRPFSKLLLLAGVVWLANAGFTIFASPAALRFQSFPILFSATVCLLVIDWLARLTQHLKLEHQQQSLAI